MTAVSVPDAMLGQGQPPRRPGDFKRTQWGAPRVSRPDDPNKTAIYGRPSGFGAQLETPYNLIKWKERQLIVGLWSIDVAGDPSLWDRDDLDKIAARAHDAAGSSDAADRGTHVHLLIQHGATEELLERGESLGIPAALQRRIVDQWCDFRDRLGVRSLAVELNVVNDELKLAGTADCHDVAERDIDTPIGTIRAGESFIGDVKTGRLTTNNDGTPKYWIKYPVQLVAYRDGVPYDVDTDTRGEW